MGIKRADKRTIDELRVEVGMKESLKKKLVMSRLTWPVHVERLGDKKTGKESRCRET